MRRRHRINGFLFIRSKRFSMKPALYTQTRCMQCVLKQAQKRKKVTTFPPPTPWILSERVYRVRFDIDRTCSTIGQTEQLCGIVFPLKKLYTLFGGNVLILNPYEVLERIVLKPYQTKTFDARWRTFFESCADILESRF